MCLCLSVYMYVCICVFMSVCVYECVFMCACVYECAHIQSSRWVTPLLTLPTAFQPKNRTLIYTLQMNTWINRKEWVVQLLCLRVYSEKSVDPSSIHQPPIFYFGVSEIHCVKRQLKKMKYSSACCHGCLQACAAGILSVPGTWRTASVAGTMPT